MLPRPSPLLSSLSLIFFLALARYLLVSISSSSAILTCRWGTSIQGEPAPGPSSVLPPFFPLSLSPPLYCLFSLSLALSYTHTHTHLLSSSRSLGSRTSRSRLTRFVRFKEERGRKESPPHASARADLSQKFARKLTVKSQWCVPRRVLFAGKRSLTSSVRRGRPSPSRVRKRGGPPRRFWRIRVN